MRYSALLAGMAAAALAVGNFGADALTASRAIENFGREADGIPQIPHFAYGPGGGTQGSSRDTAHERHINRLARKARRQERLHRHTATGHRLLAAASA